LERGGASFRRRIYYLDGSITIAPGQQDYSGGDEKHGHYCQKSYGSYSVDWT
jgi:hypothetical protein